MVDIGTVIALIKALGSGGGSGGTSDYDDLTDKPQINGVTLSGNKSGDDFGLLDAPETAGTIGQVLTSDGRGGQSWETPSGSGSEAVVLRTYSELGEDLAQIEITLPQTYNEIWLNFMVRLNDAGNTLPDGNAYVVAWLGDSNDHVPDNSVYVKNNIRSSASSKYLMNVWFKLDALALQRFASIHSNTGWSSSANVLNFGGNEATVLSSRPTKLYIRPYDTTQGYLFKSDCILGVYAK